MRQRRAKPGVCLCGQPLAKSNHSYCYDCKNRIAREWRKAHGGSKALTAEQRRRSNCRSYAHVYIKRGKLKREPCRVCGEKAEMHHSDYNKPLVVEWLCQFHHRELHKKNGKQLPPRYPLLLARRQLPL